MVVEGGVVGVIGCVGVSALMVVVVVVEGVWVVRWVVVMVFGEGERLGKKKVIMYRERG